MVINPRVINSRSLTSSQSHPVEGGSQLVAYIHEATPFVSQPRHFAHSLLQPLL
jgi:hypothetical protein